MYKVSLVIPSIRPANWTDLYADMQMSCQNHPFEIIFVGPYPLPAGFEDKQNVKYLRDFGCPSRCLQLGAYLAEGKYLAWCSDDCRIIPNAFDDAIEMFDSQLTENDGMNLLYSEGADFTGTQHEDPKYWIARTHTDLCLEGVQEGWRIAPIFMYHREKFMKWGGLDCRYEHVNMNTHDLAFSVQANGGKIFSSPARVFKFDWQPQKPDYPPILDSFINNDRPLFAEEYSAKDAAKLRMFTSYDNWRDAQTVWKRRF